MIEISGYTSISSYMARLLTLCRLLRIIIANSVDIII